MQLTCPCCSARFPIEAALTDEAARQAVAAALKIPPPLGELVLRYIALFRPVKRALSWDRAARLLSELGEQIQRGQVSRDGRDWPAPLEAWRYALEQMLATRDKLTLPLKSHGYLYEVVAGRANKAEARREQLVEEQRQHRDGARSAGPVAVGKVIDRLAGAEHARKLKEVVHGRQD